MKRNISDMLDVCSDEAVELNNETPLSPARIKELTMNKIMQNSPNKSRIPMRLLTIAAIIAVLSVSALAVGYVLGAGALFQDFFENKGGALTTGQIEVMDQIGKAFEGGVTSNGTTITPIAALADENVYYLRLRIEGPEDMILPEYNNETDGYYQLFGKDVEETMTLDLQADAYRTKGYSSDFLWLPDDDPSDNVKEVVVRIMAQAGTDLRFNDNVSKTLTIHGLWLQSPDKAYTQILDGDFAFDIGLHYESKVVQLEAGGLTWRDDEYEYTSTLKSLAISPLSLSYRFTATKPGYDRAIPAAGPFKVVLKDGNTVSMRDAPGSSSGEEYLVFDVPLDLTQVDYVQYGGHKIAVEVNEKSLGNDRKPGSQNFEAIRGTPQTAERCLQQ